MIAPDKISHFIAGWAITLSSAFIVPLPIAVFLGIATGILKEAIWDGYMQRGTASLADAVWTAAGAVSGGVFFYFGAKLLCL